jgi:hypothetical protein
MAAAQENENPKGGQGYIKKKTHGVRLLIFVWVSKCAFDVRKLRNLLATYR